MDARGVVRDAKEKMSKSIEALSRELGGIRAGKATASLLDSLRVDYYGTMVPIQQVASINVPEPRLIVVQPWDKGMVSVVSKAIRAGDLGLNPTDDGTVVRVPIPPLTEERRKELVKHVKKLGEGTRVAIRQIRRDANEHVKKLQNSKDLSEDDARRHSDEIQKATDGAIEQVDDLLKEKEKDILEI
jgi:ribosome recycling factor